MPSLFFTWQLRAALKTFDVMLFLHIFFTWLLINLVHPLIMALYALVFYGADSFHHFISPETLLLFSVVSFLLSLPCLLLGWLCLGIVVHQNYTTGTRYLLWLITAPLLILFEAFVVGVVEESFIAEAFRITIPAIVSTVLIIGIRHRQFYKLIDPDFGGEQELRLD